MQNNKQTGLLYKVIALSLSALIVGGSAVTVLPAVSGTDSSIVASATECSDFEYVENNDGGIMIIGYTGSDTEVVIPNKINGKSVTSIGNYAFFWCDSLTSISIPDSVTSIGDEVFYGCESLTSITIGNSVKSIGDWAFKNCSSLTSISIPDSVTSIGYGAFEGCKSLTSIKASENNANYSSTDGVLFNKDQTTIVTYPGGKTGAYTIPDSVTSIGDLAFGYYYDDYYEKIENFTIYGKKGSAAEIPDSVTSIGNGVFYNTAWYNNQNGDIYVGKVYYAYKGTMPENTSVTIKEGTKK